MRSLRLKILSGFGIILLLVVILSAIIITETKQTTELAQEIITEDVEELLLIENLRFNLSERISATRVYITDGNNSYKKRFYEYTEESQQIEKELLERVTDETELEVIKDIVDRSVAWGDYTVQKVYAAYDDGSGVQANLMNDESRVKALELMEILGGVIQDKESSVQELGAKITANGQSVERNTLALSLLVIVAGVIISLIVARMIVKPILQVVNRIQMVAEGDLSGEEMITKSKDEVGVLVQNMNKMVNNLKQLIQQVSVTSEQVAASSEELNASAEQTSKATEQISLAIQEVSEGSEQQASGTYEANRNVSEISTGMDQVATSIQAVVTLTEKTNQKAIDGNLVVNNTIEQMTRVQEQVSSTSSVVNTLGTKSSEIGQIVELITEVANQTNLLALNAAIEAARAGEHGRGFAVVADEVRKLAEQSGQAAEEIGKLIGLIQEEAIKAVKSMDVGTASVNEGIKMVHNTGDSFKDIAMMIEEISSQTEEVSTVVQQVSVGSQNMVAVMENIANISQQSAGNSQNVAASAEEQLASMEEISSSATSLSHIAEELQGLVGKFKV